MEYPKSIINSVEKLCEEIEKYYPTILKVKYNEDALNDFDKKVSIFKQRMWMGLYIELLRAGLLKEFQEEIEKEFGYEK